MSTMLLSDTHINTMVYLAVARPFGGSRFSLTYYFGGKHHDIDHENAERIANVLKDANLKAFNDTYSDANMTVEKMQWRYYPTKVVNISPIAYIKTLVCYEYQACSWESYKDSEAEVIVKAMRSYGIQAVPGYDEAKWQLQEDEAAEVKPRAGLNPKVASIVLVS
jgi:hypothetical protein